ncbi:MAG TPA: SRPBCC family protein [Noviherbaspirillum sp.]|nr:SRPBCC family protein [Noviherbaspirillum sp.]
MEPQGAPIVTAQMLIRKPVEKVFDAFINPAVTTLFWFSKSSGPLEAGREVLWEWEGLGASAVVRVQEIEPCLRILIEWDDPPCPVEWLFTPYEEQGTLVRISNWGFKGSADEVMTQALDAKGGFTMVLAGAKALLEHGIVLDLVGDQYPERVLRAFPA